VVATWRCVKGALHSVPLAATQGGEGAIVDILAFDETRVEGADRE
jgi:hypothetical protein